MGGETRSMRCVEIVFSLIIGVRFDPFFGPGIRTILDVGKILRNNTQLRNRFATLISLRTENEKHKV